jgi:demethylmenaquinone methyltransferase/2-methoxy-6-polyprenyl-1,4-benzoquinol methylase
LDLEELASTRVHYSSQAAMNHPPQHPHPVLPAYYSSAELKGGFVKDLFDETAVLYDRINSAAFLGTSLWYRRHALRRAGLQRGMRMLDVAAGTGAMSQAAAAIIGGESIVCCDPSANMLALAAAKVKNAPIVQASAEQMPLPSDRFDFLVLGYALRHVADLGQAFDEFHRVLAPRGRLLILEISRPRTRWKTALARAYFRDVVPLLSFAVTGRRRAMSLMRYYWDTIEACVPPESIISALRESRFADVQRHVELGLFSEYTAIKMNDLSVTT